jgi:hypothetical protein
MKLVRETLYNQLLLPTTTSQRHFPGDWGQWNNYEIQIKHAIKDMIQILDQKD